MIRSYILDFKGVWEMRKSNTITFLSFILIIIAVIVFMSLSGKQATAVATDTDKGPVTAVETEKEDTAPPAEKTETDGNKDAAPPAEKTEPKKKKVSMKDALFMGASRTVGLFEYSGMNKADYFASVGMSVFNIYDSEVSLPRVGKVSFSELLKNKKYGKIYVMLGINEMVYSFDSIVSEYKSLIKYIRKKQPDAVVILQANLYVTKSRSDSDDIINNKKISRLNKALESMADGKNVFFIDANPLFSDGKGNLSAEKSEDNTHLYAKYYSDWGKWIRKQTGSIIGEG